MNFGLLWECSCGHLEHADNAPEECPNCNKIESFAQVPEELIEEREKDLLEAIE